MRKSFAFSGLVRCLGLGLALTLAPLGPAFADEPTVFAAASLKNVLEEIAEAWKADGGKGATLTFAGSPALAKQIEQGAPADIFISADLAWMDYLDKAGLIDADTRRDLLGNSIVLIAPRDTTVSASIDKDFGLSELLGDGRLAMANTDSVPAGVYGKAALQSLGAWDGVKDKVAQAENVRAALLLVSRGESPLGIVYATDARAEPGVKVVDTFPEDSHPAIIYPAALTKDAANAEDAAAFLNYLQGPRAHAIFTEAGFTVLARTN